MSFSELKALSGEIGGDASDRMWAREGESTRLAMSARAEICDSLTQLLNVGDSDPQPGQMKVAPNLSSDRYCK